MLLIIDSNILISASLDANSELFELIKTSFEIVDFVTPEFAISEINRHKKRICEKVKKDLGTFNFNLNLILNNITVLPDNELSDNDIKNADLLTQDIDLKDTIYIAFSLALDALFWTGDNKLYKGLKRKKFNYIINTKELKAIIKGI